MSRKLTYAAAALVATLAVGTATNEATAQDFGGFLRIGDEGFAIGLDVRDDDYRSRRHHSHPRYDVVRERVWRKGYWKTVEIPAVYRTLDRRNGPDLRALVRPSRLKRVFVPGYWDRVERRVIVGQTRCYEDHGRLIRRDRRGHGRRYDRRQVRRHDRYDRGDGRRRDRQSSRRH